MTMNPQELQAQAATLADLLNDPHSAIKDLVTVIEGDPELSNRIMTRANSALYGVDRRRVLDLKAAIIRIGFRNVKRIIRDYTLEILGEAARANARQRAAEQPVEQPGEMEI